MIEYTVMQPTANDFKLARVFLNHSLKIKTKEKVVISASDIQALPLVKAVFIETLKLGAYPVVESEMNFQFGRSNAYGMTYEFYKHANNWQLSYVPHEVLQARVDWADAFVRIVTFSNTKELSQIPHDKIILHQKNSRPYLEKIVHKDRWVLTYYPTSSMAQEAGVSLDWLFNFYYKASIVNYDQMKQRLTTLEKVLDNGSEVRIVGHNTDLAFSIKGRDAKAAYGERNVPDGEVFLAPVHETVEGNVFFEFPSEYNGTTFEDVYLEFKNGRVVTAKSKNTTKTLNKILDTDYGGRSLGELGVGCNYQIKRSMKSTLFDEKIGGTIHLALGMSYREARGGATVGYNESAIHWDIVKDMRKKGSVLYVDDKVIMKEGKFTII